MSYDDYLYSDRLSDEYNNNDNTYITKSRDMSNISDNVVFKNEEDDLMIKETEISDEPRVSYCGFFSDSQFSTIINLTSSTIGGGCLNFPAIIDDLGLPLTLIIFIFVTLAVFYTIDLLRNFVVDTKSFSFALMTNEILGKCWLKIYVICSLIFYISIEINNLYMIYTILLRMFKIKEGHNLLLLNVFFFPISIIIEIFMCSYIAKIKRVHLFSLISSILFMIALIIIIIEGSKNIISGTDKLQKDRLISPPISDKNEHFFRIMTHIIEFLYGYSYHSSYPTLLKNLRIVDDQNTKEVHYLSFLFIFFSYFLITFFGFFTKHPVSHLIERDFEKTVVVIVIFRIILCLFLMSVVPLRFIVIRDNYYSLLKRNETNRKISFKRDLLYVILILLFCNIVVYLTNGSIISLNLGIYCIRLFGGIFGVIIGFVLPVINYIGANGKRKVKSIIGYILTGIFCVIGIFSAAYSFYGICKENEIC